MLLDFQDSDESLRYRFEDVPTLPGLNEFRLVFYGPRGEVLEEEQQVWADGGLAGAGETRFWITVNQHEEDLLTLGDPGDGDGRRGELRALGELEHGFGESFTLALGAASLPLIDDERRQYATLGARGEWRGALLRADLLGANGGGFAGGFAWQTRLRGVAIGLSHHEFRDFLSERTIDYGGESLLGRTEASIDGSLRAAWLPLHYRFGLGENRIRGGRQETTGDLRISTWLRPVFLSHTLRTGFEHGGPSNARYVQGDILASARRGFFGLRGLLTYAALDGEISSMSLIGDWTPGDFVTTRLGLTHEFADRTALFVGLSRRIGGVVVSASVEVDENGLARAGVGLSFGLWPDPYSSRTHVKDPGATRTGGLAARTFLDRNANGVYDDPDEPLSDIGFVAPTHESPRTGPDGTALVAELPVDRRLEIEIDPRTLDDPHWIAPRAGETVVLRPGAPLRLEFPIVPVGEIDGWVQRVRSDRKIPAPGISVQLVDERGEITASAASEVDGFYLFQEVLPGRYRLRVDPEQCDRLQLIPPPERWVEIPEGGSVLSDQNLELHRVGAQSKEPTPL